MKKYILFIAEEYEQNTCFSSALKDSYPVQQIRVFTSEEKHPTYSKEIIERRTL